MPGRFSCRGTISHDQGQVAPGRIGPCALEYRQRAAVRFGTPTSRCVLVSFSVNSSEG